MSDKMSERGTLKDNEPHPAAESARSYIASLGMERLAIWQESFSSCAIESNRLGEICFETLRRLMAGEPVSDLYLLGLAWTMNHREVTS